ncbi:MAG: hypothetical protein EHM91_04505 [Planctomycetota bacterium]|nr:MAG: hypothetical protein EHM91_04505 [Planctomycetota bacterium]
MAVAFASWMLAEARALLTRLDQVKPFALRETMVPAAALSFQAQTAIESYLTRGRQELREQVHEYLEWLRGPQARTATPTQAHRRFVFLRLRFNAVLSQFDIFSEAMSQRSEADFGVWLSGLDVVARDGLALPGYFDAPPVICYLARGPGAAIRRARTRLPGGGENPVAIVRIPRERMIGSGIASSLMHEVGHQGAALLDLVPSLRKAVRQQKTGPGLEATAWQLWHRWLSEIVADLWAVARVGVASTAGLVGVVSLPAAFVFRVNTDDPHPIPWIRVKLSSAVGEALYPHPQWKTLTRMWESFYPADSLDPDRRSLLAALEATMPRLVEVLIGHRPDSLGGRSLAEVMATRERQPSQLATLREAWRGDPALMRRASPSLVFAVIGQARVDGAISPEAESGLLADLLKEWALRSTLDSSEVCATKATGAPRSAVPAPVVYPAQAVI